MSSGSAYRFLLAVDPSLTCSGWALFDVGSGALRAIGKIRSLPPKFPLAERLAKVQADIVGLLTGFELQHGDLLVCESQTTMRDPKAAFKVEQVRSIFEVLGRSKSMVVPGRLNPRSVQFEVMGLGGRQTGRADVKSVAQATARALYGLELGRMSFPVDERSLSRNQDIVDAILVGRLALLRVQASVRSGQGIEQFFDQRDNGRRYTRRVRA